VEIVKLPDVEDTVVQDAELFLLLVHSAFKLINGHGVVPDVRAELLGVAELPKLVNEFNEHCQKNPHNLVGYCIASVRTFKVKSILIN
jgi:hypothetical protein